jgi:hypothetical protein
MFDGTQKGLLCERMGESTSQPLDVQSELNAPPGTRFAAVGAPVTRPLELALLFSVL